MHLGGFTIGEAPNAPDKNIEEETDKICTIITRSAACRAAENKDQNIEVDETEIVPVQPSRDNPDQNGANNGQQNFQQEIQRSTLTRKIGNGVLSIL